MPDIETVVETGIYADDLDAAARFYADVLGLTIYSQRPGRHIFFAIGRGSMLLVFRPSATLEPGELPSHGTSGPGHFALGIPTDQFDAWRQHLAAHDVPVECEFTWPRGGQSLYIRDPAGNSVELLTRGLWGSPDGW